MPELGLYSTLAGIYVVHRCDEPALEHIVRSAIATYLGPDLGGLDILIPNPTGDAWILLGRWTDCFAEDVEEAAGLLRERLAEAIEGLNHEAVLGTAPGRLALTSWVAVHGAIIDGVAPARWQGWLTDTFPRIPRWHGLHMGAPHWLGDGVTQTQGRIEHVTPYARLDLRADGTVMFTGVADDADLRTWIPRLRAALAV